MNEVVDQRVNPVFHYTSYRHILALFFRGLTTSLINQSCSLALPILMAGTGLALLS